MITQQVNVGNLRAYKMKIVTNRKGLIWREIVLWAIFIAVLILLLIIYGAVRGKMIVDLDSLFNFLRM